MGQKELVLLCEQVRIHDGIWTAIPDGGSGLNVHEFELSPYDFIHQAEFDLEHGTRGSDQNAYSNAKRAIACSMDEILFTFGFNCQRWHNKRKVETISAMGIPAPLILEKINATRNMLEHSYKKATRNEAEDAVGVATLFVEAAAPVVRLFPGEFYVARDDEENGRSLYFSYGWGTSGGFSIREKGNRSPDADVEISVDDLSFVPIVAMALAANRDVAVNKAVDEFRASLRH